MTDTTGRQSVPDDPIQSNGFARRVTRSSSRPFTPLVGVRSLELARDAASTRDRTLVET